MGVNTLLMSEKLDLFFLNDHNVQYAKSWLKTAMYLFLLPGIRKYMDARKHDRDKIQDDISVCSICALCNAFLQPSHTLWSQ